MTPLLQCICFICCVLFSFKEASSQVKIHAHNDYEKQNHLHGAIQQRAFSIEADVYPVNGKLMVAHDKKEIKEHRTLDALYIQPIVQLFTKNDGTVTGDTSYTFSLVIDIKENQKEVFRLLHALIQPYLHYFDRSKNKKAIQLIISGERGDINQWTNSAPYIYYDGRPYEHYSESTLVKVAVISDNYHRYNSDTIRQSVIEKVHQLGKPIRFWAAPDEPRSWNSLIQSGVDIINTDKPEEVRKLLDKRAFTH